MAFTLLLYSQGNAFDIVQMYELCIDLSIHLHVNKMGFCKYFDVYIYATGFEASRCNNSQFSLLASRQRYRYSMLERPGEHGKERTEAISYDRDTDVSVTPRRNFLDMS